MIVTVAAPGSERLVVESAANAAPGATAPRIVLDTNVCLDLLLFADPQCDALRSALQASSVQAITNEACREEWLRVLSYPQLGLAEDRRIALCASFDALTQRVTGDLPLEQRCRLPRCSDPDDQKFIELAAASGAQWLLSRDHALLKLGRRTAAAGLFVVTTPQDWRLVVSIP